LIEFDSAVGLFRRNDGIAQLNQILPLHIDQLLTNLIGLFFGRKRDIHKISHPAYSRRLTTKNHRQSRRPSAHLVATFTVLARVFASRLLLASDHSQWGSVANTQHEEEEPGHAGGGYSGLCDSCATQCRQAKAVDKRRSPAPTQILGNAVNRLP